MKKETLGLIALIILGFGFYYGINLFNQQKSFQQKQQCHDEAVSYVDNKQKTIENQAKLSNDKSFYAFIYDSYNQTLNTCVVYYGNTYIPDTVKYPNLGITYYEHVDDVLVGKQLDLWFTSYKVNSYNVELASGNIRGKDTSSRADFDSELEALFGADYKNYLTSPSPTPPQPSTTSENNSNNSNVVTTPTIPPAYRQTFMNICTSGSIYCTCLYNSLHQNYSDAEIASHTKSNFNNVLGGTDPMFVNALAECNNRFGAK